MNLDDLLNQVADDATGRTLPEPSEIRRAGDRLRAGSRQRTLLAVAAAVAALALVGTAAVLADDNEAKMEPSQPPELRVTVFDPNGDVSSVAGNGTRETVPLKDADRFALSPDGDRIAYTTPDSTTVNRRLWIADADGSDALRLPAPCIGCQPGYGIAWSHDGTRLAYVAWTPGHRRAQLRIQTLDTGREQVVRMPAGVEPRGPSFSPDDWELAVNVVAGSGQYIATLDLADARPSPTRLSDDFNQVQLPSWSADGRTVYFTATTRGEDNNDITGSNDLYAAPTDGSEARQVTHAGRGVRYFGVTTYGQQFLISRAVTTGPWVVGLLNGDGTTFTPLEGPDGKQILGTAAELQP